MFATAISHSAPTDANTRTSPRRELPTRASLSDRTSADHPVSVFGNCLRELFLHEREIARGLLDRDTRLETADAVQEARFPLPQQPRVRLAWQPHVGSRGGERRRHDADDRISLAADRQGLADRRRIAIEAPRPETLADHDRVRAGLPLLVVGEPSTGNRLLAVDLEEPRRDANARKTLGLADRSCR